MSLKPLLELEMVVTRLERVPVFPSVQELEEAHPPWATDAKRTLEIRSVNEGGWVAAMEKQENTCRAGASAVRQNILSWTKNMKTC